MLLVSNLAAPTVAKRRSPLKRALLARDLWFIKAVNGKELRAARKDPSYGAPLRGKRVLITGASSGIGAAAAYQFGRLGAKVVVVARRAEELEAVAAKIRAEGGEAEAITCDLRDYDAVDKLAETVNARFGGVDVLVNNAGHSIRRPAAESLERWHDFERIMQINFFAPLRLTRGLLPGMLERRDGHVINVASLAVANQVAPYFTAYAAAKAALSIATRIMGFELRREGVHFSTLFYPLVRTEMIAPTGEYDRVATLSPEEAAEWMTLAARIRPIRVIPRFSGAVGFFNAVSPKRVDYFFRRSGIRF
ncbi:MAG: SDR family oxidoreductase [Segniliparus sp.]|uniref:SDR family oxidoreductase n=1 Tax=Segniliparus sp. TaxID=2804064 RepID=UPI003F3B8F0D